MQIVEDNIFIVKPGKSTEDLSLYVRIKLLKNMDLSDLYD
jgi:hypothetical protein